MPKPLDEPVHRLIDVEALGKEIRRRRKAAGLSDAGDLAAALEVVGYRITRRALYQREQGNTIPDIEFLAAFCIALYGSEWRWELASMIGRSMTRYAKTTIDFLEEFSRDEIRDLLEKEHPDEIIF